MAVATKQHSQRVRPHARDSVRKQLRGSSLLLLGRFLSRGINFVSQLLIVRTLTTASYGAFAYGLAVVAFWGGLSWQLQWTNVCGSRQHKDMPIEHKYFSEVESTGIFA